MLGVRQASQNAHRFGGNGVYHGIWATSDETQIAFMGTPDMPVGFLNAVDPGDIDIRPDALTLILDLSPMGNYCLQDGFSFLWRNMLKIEPRLKIPTEVVV